MRIGLWLAAIVAALVAAAPAHADTESCADLRKNILEMERSSVRPPGWVMLDTFVRWEYARDCVLQPTRKPEREYWFRIDGSPTGVKATCPDRDETGCTDRPQDGAYAATPEIGAYCARSTNPSMCAMAKRMEAACLRPLDTQERVQCESILDGRVPDLPPASEKLPPVADLLAPKGVNAPTMPDAKVAADPGFQRMCAQAETNFNTCATRRQHMTTYGSGGLGSDGQADAFYQCQKIYQGVLNMCHATKVVAAKTAPNAPAATPPKAAPPPQQQAKGTPPQASSMPPAQPQPQPMSAKCQQLVSNYVAAAQANDGPRALAGYNALKSAGGCNVLDKVDRAPPPAQPSGGDSRFIARGARPNTAAAIGACDRSADGCAEAMRQLEQAASPAAQAAMIMNAVQVGLELGAAMASGLAATMPQGGGGGGTNYNSIGNRPAARTYGQGSAQPAPHVPQQPPVSCGSGPVCTAR